MLSDDQVAELTRRYQASLKRLTGRAASQVEALWRSLGSWDADDIERFLEMVDPIVAATKKSTVRLSNGYHSQIAGRRAPAFYPGDVGSAPPDPRAPFTSHWHALSQGLEWDDAIESGAKAIHNDIVGFIHSTARRTAGVTHEKLDIRPGGYRRVLTGVSCEWCALVSTQRYTSADAADFGHRACDCTVLAITDEADPGRFINTPLLARLNESNVSGRIYQREAPKRSLKAAENASERRDRALNDLLSESDPKRRVRLQARASYWDRKATSFRAQAAEQQARFAQLKQVGTTGYVTPSGAPAPAP